MFIIAQVYKIEGFIYLHKTIYSKIDNIIISVSVDGKIAS